MEFIRSSLLKDHTTATEVRKIDLPVNPLSHLIISMDGYNVTDEATLAEIIAFINKVEVTQMGKTVMSLQSEDLYGLNTYLFRRRPSLTQNIATDNEQRGISLIVPFGRKIFDPLECFPATKKGELTLSLDTTVPSASLDNSTLNIEAVELVGATPQKYLKAHNLVVAAPGATGDNDVELPRGNEIIAVQIRMTTFPTTSSHTFGVDNAKILCDNKEYGYASARAQCLIGDMINRVDGKGTDIAAFGQVQPPNIVWLDYDPNGDGQYLLESNKYSSVKARLNMGVNEATVLSIFELVAA